MVSNQKRMRYVSDDVSSSEDDSYDDLDFQSKKENELYLKEKIRRKPICQSKNALMARENRIKKKLYVNKLEKEIGILQHDNKKLSTILKNQSELVSDLRNEIKYLKSVVANSSDIKNLIRNIHSSTGMSVSSSLDKNLSLKPFNIPKINMEERNDNSEAFPNFDCILGNDVNLNMDVREDFSDFPLNMPENIFKFESPASLEEHNYTARIDDDDDVGVCLHVSKHRVSLEFCTKCSEKAEQSWSLL